MLRQFFEIKFEAEKKIRARARRYDYFPKNKQTFTIQIVSIDLCVRSISSRCYIIGRRETVDRSTHRHVSSSV